MQVKGQNGHESTDENQNCGVTQNISRNRQGYKSRQRTNNDIIREKGGDSDE